MKLLIQTAQLRFSKNTRIKRGYFSCLELKGVLPGCRKTATLTASPSGGYIWIKNLYSHNGEARVSYQDWTRIVNSAKSVESKFEYDRIAISDEMNTQARHDVLDEMIASAERQIADIQKHRLEKSLPEYKIDFSEVVIEG